MTLHAGAFELLAYAPAHKVAPNGTLAVYIEGDGFAWISRELPSDDPTPRDPVALRLALAQPDGTAAYLGRPCQYVDAATTGCAERYWTEERFAPEVIEASNRAIDQLMARFGATRLTLVGYSGGAAVAALVAARRHDVGRLVTVAGNLDHPAWTQFHRVAPLTGSLNPADVRKALARIRQWHFVGRQDRVIPPSLIEDFVAAYGDGSHATVRAVEGYDHHCCWAENWPQLWQALRQ